MSTRRNGSRVAATCAAVSGRLPRQSGCSPRKTPVACSGEPKTGAARASDRATTASTPPLAVTSSPATMASWPMGVSARSAARSSSAGGGGGPLDPRRRRDHAGELLLQQVHLQRQEDRARRRAGGVVEGPADVHGQLARRPQLVHPLRHRAGQADEVAGEQRVGGDVTFILLTCGDDQWAAVGAGVGEVADGVAQAGRGVQVQEGRPPGQLRVAVRHGHRARLLEGEDVADVLRPGEGIDQRQLGAAGVAEDMADALAAEDVEQDFTSQHARHRARRAAAAAR